MSAGPRIKILQYNAHLFGGISELKLGAMQLKAKIIHDDEARRDALARAILQSGADIVCLEEVWSDAYKIRLAMDFRHVYTYTFYEPFSDGPVLGKKQLGSGLFLLSKHKIVSPVFTAFSRLCGADDFAAKGLITAEIHLQAEGESFPLLLLFTHTQAEESDSATVCRADNINEICSALTRQRVDSGLNGAGRLPRIVAGDLNVVAENDDGEATREYRQVKSAFADDGFSDLAAALYPDRRRDRLYTSDALNNKLIPIFDPADQARSRLDYVFVANLPAGQCTLQTPTDWRYESTNGPADISDHYPVIASMPLSVREA
jgi:endonuclease/exonuclease/phosphatase family metal-dependent hydrolase